MKVLLDKNNPENVSLKIVDYSRNQTFDSLESFHKYVLGTGNVRGLNFSFICGSVEPSNVYSITNFRAINASTMVMDIPRSRYFINSDSRIPVGTVVNEFILKICLEFKYQSIIWNPEVVPLSIKPTVRINSLNIKDLIKDEKDDTK
jgi:hypothetical protein